VNDWTAKALAYLEERKVAGDWKARGLLARRDCPRPPPEKEIPALDAAAAHARARETLLAKAKRRMHDEVWEWNLRHTVGFGAAYGRCDCGCGYPFRSRDEGECDHWKGRKGPDAHTRENGWRLRKECHEEKDGRRPMTPGADSFNERRRVYCARAGIPFVPRKELLHAG
jgi:hypothetical protein